MAATNVDERMLVCLRCHLKECHREHVGHPGRCEVCGRDALVTACDHHLRIPEE